MKQCPVCTLELDKMKVAEPVEDEIFICKTSHEDGIIFSASYKPETEELIYFNITIDQYYIENCYPKNKTNISIKDDKLCAYRPFLFLPLVHFELCNLEAIKKKLKVLVMIY